MNHMDIISYKHNGLLHRVWKNVYKIHEDDDIVVLVNNKVDVIDGDGRKWKTREPAICCFFKHCWYNVICMIKPTDIFYYCNLSSPFIIDIEGLKYIDYDLDVKSFPDGEIRILDADEYDFNSKDMNYSDELKDIIQKNMNDLIERIKRKDYPFNKEWVMDWYEKFFCSK